MSSLAPYQLVKPVAGEATGIITGFSHIQMVVRDMQEAVPFYRDVLGLRIVKTTGQAALDLVTKSPVSKNYFFELGNGELLTLIEVKDAPTPQRSIWDLWPAQDAPPVLQKMDHLAFNVDTLADLRWFRQHLQSSGVPVTDILGRERFVKSIYFTDPTGNPLEIATFAREDPSWEGHQPEDWYGDDDPVRSLFA
jgi:catechol 2,3-dioxygenase-like lactoylglutathione lyase family enzyme